MERTRKRLRIHAGDGRRAGNQIRLARSRTEIQSRQSDRGKRYPVEEMDRVVQREDAFEGRIPRPLRVRLRFAGSVCDRKGWKDVLRILRTARKSSVPGRGRIARIKTGDVSRTGLHRRKGPGHGASNRRSRP